MKMFVANCTNQHKSFIYSLPEQVSTRTQEIIPGGQIQLSGDLRAADIEAVVGQHSLYGMFPAASVAQTQAHIDLLYSTDRPVREEQMRQALERNLALMENKGREFRQNAAIAANQIAQQQSPNEFKGLAMTILEQRSDGGSPIVHEEIRVAKPGYEPIAPEAKRGRGRPRKGA